MSSLHSVMSFIQIARAPFTWLRHVLFTLLIASFHLPRTLSCPFAHFAFSPFPRRTPNKQTERRNQHTSQRIRFKKSFCESSCLRSGLWLSKMGTLRELGRREGDKFKLTFG
ncbi:hypothetical protein K443DRAFT_420397 [Laccaria amethystina LaAM-08-1]|uniref:Uncharacterized protein n=1 Tax=Laccaria amethystina LaAM-08-1 TaxID=1095629 RepID=A0A0C9WPF8_9AGAR|nr:hypothetical protein K443DRAFT_420397 [Laccaria amethystina LaAM-08-1]